MLGLLGCASQRIEFLLLEWFGTESMREMVQEWKRKERGATPGLAECGVALYVISTNRNKLLLYVAMVLVCRFGMGRDEKSMVGWHIGIRLRFVERGGFYHKYVLYYMDSDEGFFLAGGHGQIQLFDVG